jgi:hypothetical protein
MYVDLATAEESEQFWKGMLLGLDEKKLRDLKKKKELVENGISQAVAL